VVKLYKRALFYSSTCLVLASCSPDNNSHWRRSLASHAPVTCKIRPLANMAAVRVHNVSTCQCVGVCCSTSAHTVHNTLLTHNTYSCIVIRCYYYHNIHYTHLYCHILFSSCHTSTAWLASCRPVLARVHRRARMRTHHTHIACHTPHTHRV